MIACHHYQNRAGRHKPPAMPCLIFYFIFEGLVCAGRHDFEVVMIACHHYLKIVPAGTLNLSSNAAKICANFEPNFLLYF